MKMQKQTEIRGNRIPIYFTFNRYYVLAACITIYSLLKNANNYYTYELYVVHDSLNKRDIEQIKKVANRFANASLQFIHLERINSYWSDIKTKSHFSKEIFYKLLAAEVFPQYDRILFSDVDVVFMQDISDVYYMYETEKFYFAGTANMFDESLMANYSKNFSIEEMQIIKNNEISAGFMLINTKSLREDGMTTKLKEYYQKNAYRLFLPEQDCIALTCPPSYIKIIPAQYNISVTWYKNPSISAKLSLDHIQPIMLHFPGENKPWNSFRAIKGDIWLIYCAKAQLLHRLVILQPLFLFQRIRRYSLKRFLKKLAAKISSNNKSIRNA